MRFAVQGCGLLDHAGGCDGHLRPPDEVLAALVAPLRRELAEMAAALEEARSELAQARERITELEALLKQNARNSSEPPSSEGLVRRTACRRGR